MSENGAGVIPVFSASVLTLQARPVDGVFEEGGGARAIVVDVAERDRRESGPAGSPPLLAFPLL
jgi:hypothetical protein